jgi:superfamily II DNA/RNA helicase
MYINKCIDVVERMVIQQHELGTSDARLADRTAFLASTLAHVRGEDADHRLHATDLHAAGGLSSKAEQLLDFLRHHHRPDVQCLVFVKTRSTAWSLSDIINSHLSTRNLYRAFSFVGVSNPSHKSAFDFAELSVQHDNLENFRRGDMNLCVATSVLEEGVDVPAMNLVVSWTQTSDAGIVVEAIPCFLELPTTPCPHYRLTNSVQICFDERPNFRSFVQSRGRARQKNSELVMFSDALLKMGQWQALEAEMKEECYKSTEEVKEREKMEEHDELSSEVFRVASTG